MMKRAVLYSGVLIFMMTVFMLGVASGLKGEALSFGASQGSYPLLNPGNPPLDKKLYSRHVTLSDISGEKSTINGIPIKIWLGKSMDSARRIANTYCSTWNNDGLYASQAGNRDALLASAVDPEKKKFYGAMAYNTRGRSTVIPFSVDMTTPKDTWDRDFPSGLRKKKGFHFRTADGKLSYETFFYADTHPISETVSMVESAFLNQGWKKENDLRAPGSEQEIRTFIKGDKTCIASAGPAPKNSRGKSIVVIQMGNI